MENITFETLCIILEKYGERIFEINSEEEFEAYKALEDKAVVKYGNRLTIRNYGDTAFGLVLEIEE